jgi:hypothetical protein
MMFRKEFFRRFIILYMKFDDILQCKSYIQKEKLFDIEAGWAQKAETRKPMLRMLLIFILMFPLTTDFMGNTYNSTNDGRHVPALKCYSMRRGSVRAVGIWTVTGWPGGAAGQQGKKGL